MSWGSCSTLKCVKCGNVYKIENSTLIMNRVNYDKCPKCKSDGKVISSSSILGTMQKEEELFRARKKRVKI